MRIALASDWYIPRIGGLEQQMRDLARQLTARGHVVEIITATAGAPQVDGIQVHRLDLAPLVPRWSIAWRPKLFSEVHQVVAGGRFDIVHAHSAFSPVALAACLAARRCGVPCVFTEHSVLRHVGGVVLKTTDRLFGWSQWPDVLSGVSPYLANELAACVGREVEVLRNGVSPEDWPPAVETDPPRVVSVARFARRKRPEDLVGAIPKILAQLKPGLHPRFTLVGDGPKRARVERAVARLRVQDHLELTGWLDRAALKQVLRQSTVFVLPSIKESLSIVVLEALSCGLPVVAMNHGGVGDIIEHGREGFLAEDSDEFAKYIALLLNDRELRQRMAALTRSATARFTWDKIIDRHLTVYDLAISRRNSATSALPAFDGQPGLETSPVRPQYRLSGRRESDHAE